MIIVASYKTRKAIMAEWIISTTISWQNTENGVNSVMSTHYYDIAHIDVFNNHSQTSLFNDANEL